MKFLTIIAMFFTLMSTLIALVFCMGMGANASEAQILALKLWMLGFSLLGIAGIAAGIYLLRVDQAGWAAMASIGPTIIIFIIFLVAMFK